MARHPRLNDEEILARARPVFVERGYAARTQQIAAAVGLTWGAIALRFGSKRSLFVRAMAGPDEAQCRQRLPADLPGQLLRLWHHLSECWPRRLQQRLAGTQAGAADHDDELLRTLAAALTAHAQAGSVRDDVDPEAMARVVLACVAGDVSLRFVAGEPAPEGDRAALDGLSLLLSGGGRRG